MILRNIFLALLLLVAFTAGAQELSRKTEKLIGKSKEAMIGRSWEKAVAYMEEAVENEPDNFLVYLELANLHYSLRDLSKMLPALEKAFELNPVWKPGYHDFYFILGKESFESGAYKKAKGPIEEYIKRGYNKEYIELSKIISQSIVFAQEQQAKYKPEDYDIKRINSDQFFRSVYFPFFTLYPQENMYFTAQRVNDIEEGIYRARMDGENFEKLEEVPVVNTKANEGAAATSADGRVMVFTRCGRGQGFGSCDLYISYLEGDEWSVPENLGEHVNSSAWESQPYLSSDGRILIFSSNKRGGVGKRDLYYSIKGEEGEWLPAKNLGRKVNTIADEISPFLSLSADTLYYSSNGKIGMGGFDFYKIPWDLSAEAENLGLPFNDHTPQISYHKKLDGSIYWAHELATTEKYPPSEILFIEKNEQEELLLAFGKVLDAKSKKPLYAKIQIYDIKADSLLRETYSNSMSGGYKVLIPQKSEYSFYVESEGYLFQSVQLSEIKGPKNEKDFYLSPIAAGATVDLNNIYFEFDSYELSEKSIQEIEKIYQFLKQNNRVSIEIQGYTDNVGAANYNKVLSTQRAKGVYNALIKRGISENRLSYKGLGATPLQNGEFKKVVRIIIL